MKLIDTNVFSSYWNGDEPESQWAKGVLIEAIAAGEACVSAVSVAELCAYAGRSSESVMEKLSGMGVELVDVPVGASKSCGEAYMTYLARRKAETKTEGPRIPMPDFFIGAHAEFMGFELITGDKRRFRTYFPSVPLIVPPSE